MGPGAGEWVGLICPLVFKFVITSSRSSLLLALLVLDEEDCRLNVCAQCQVEFGKGSSFKHKRCMNVSTCAGGALECPTP